MSSRLPLAIYEAMHEADIPGPWHYKGYKTVLCVKSGELQ